MKKIFILICTFVQILGIVKAYSQSTWDGISVDYSWYTGHEEETAYTINTANELAGLSWLVKDGGVTFAGKTINIGSDPANPVVIDLGGNTWTPIGYYASSSAIYPFRGNVNGNNCTIKNFRTSSSYRGLFGYVRSDTDADNDILIQDINVEANVSGSQYVGGICGFICGHSKKIDGVQHYRRNAKIQNCTFNGTVSASSSDSYVGGIAGIAYYTEINACATAGRVSGTSYVGGIVGDAYSASSSSSYKPIVQNCANSALVSGANVNVGGIVGYAYYAIVRYNVNGGCIFGNSNYIGGIIGYIAKSTSVSYCLNAGTVNTGLNEGGSIVGKGGTTTTTYCYYDSQFSEKKGIDGTDEADKYEGKLTSEITGSSPAGLSGANWSSDYWAFNAGFFPIPKPLESSNFAKLASAAVFLDPSDTWSNLSTPFTACSDASWDSNNTSFIDIASDGSSTTVNGSGRAELTATIGGLSKVVIIDTEFEDHLYGELTIDDVDDLKAFRDAINGVAADYKGVVSYTGFSEYTFNVTSDINLDGEDWEPIGTSAHPFCGYIYGDGDGKTISGLSITASEGYKGLFGYVQSGTIENLTVKGNLRGTTYLGGICGYIKGSASIRAQIYNCHFIGEITTTSTSSAYVGGVCGYAAVYSDINVCSATGSVMSPNQKASYMGGIAGYFYGGSSTGMASLQGCINLAEVSGNGYISGIAGCVSRYANIENNLNAGNVYGKTAMVGGVIGSCANTYVVNVNKNINAATVISGASVIGNFASTGNEVAPEDNYYDNQRSILEDSRATGSTTSALVALSLEGWTTTDGYPLPDGFSNEGVMTIAKTIVTFSGSEAYNAVSGNITLQTADGVSWESDSTEIVSNSGEVTGVLGNATLTVSKSDYYKKVLISVAVDEDPLTIARYEDLVSFRDAVNAGLEGSYKGHANNNGFAGVNFKVTGNIDMTDAENAWVAIGTSTNPFRGNFDGGSNDGFAFTNMTINASGSYTGLFGYVFPTTTSSTIENIDLSGTITAKGYTGAIVGYAKGTNAERNVTIDNCHFNGSVAGSSNVGGICGYAGAYTNISNCTSAGTKITGSSTSVGGICGYSTGNATTTNKISGCASMSKNLRGTGNVGGIVGYAQNTDVSYSVNAAIVNANNAVVGGIAGNVLSGASLTECLNFITIYEIGYIYGTNEGSDNITNCYYDSKFCVAGTANGTAKTTAEMIGLSLSSTNWTTGSGSYPKPKGIAERSETKVACAPITFTVSTEDNQNTRHTYNIYTTGGIEWSSPSDGDVISIAGSSVTLNTEEYSKSVMVAALDGWEKEIDLFNSEFGNLLLIPSYAKLVEFRTAVNAGPSGEYEGVSAMNGFAGKNIRITANIAINANWVPIGTATYPFKGTFDGQGYTVSNLRHTSSSTPRGLFGYIENAEIRNLNVNTGTYTTKATTYGGGIVGNSVNSTIEDCSFNGQIASTSTWIGGIVGKMVSTTVRRCVTAGTITSSASNYVGGICGHASYGESASVIEDCASNMDIFGVSSVGGIAGYISNSTIQRCINAGNVSGQTNNVGGIVGYETDDMAVVANNLNTGTVYTGGGVIGFKHPDATATNNYYDNQRSVDLHGIAEVGEDGDPSDTDATENATVDLIGTQGLFASGWTESAGMYPVPSAISSHNAAKLAAVPVLFGSQKYNLVRDNFNVGTIADLNWESNNTEYIPSISGSLVTVNGSGYNTATLTATYNSWKKTVPVLNPTDENPLLISTLAELKDFRNAVNAGGSGSYKGVPNVAGFSGKDFKLTYSGNYDLNSEEWEPIGKSASYTFNGNLDGNGKNIINLSVNASDADYKGLFGYIIGGSIKNLNVKGNISGKSYVGGICGYVKGANGDNYSAITNCTFNGNVTAATSYAGGMTGYNGNYTTIDTCRVAGAITASASYAGGITGTSVGTSSYRNAVTSCTNAAKVSVNTSYAGGIVGENTYSNVQYCNNGGDVSGSSYLTGGITGHNKSSATVVYCVSTSYVNNGGAIVGYNEATATGNFYDKQRTSAKGISATDGTSADQSGKAVGLLTEAMSGLTPSGLSGDGWTPAHWTFVDGLYPVPANLESDDFAVVTSIPIFLVGNWNNVDESHSPFTLGSPTGTVWGLVNDNGYITISGTEATVNQVSELNSEILVATLNGISKKFYVCDFSTIPDLYIYTVAELQAFRDAVNNRGEGMYKGILNNDGYLGVTFILAPTEDIDLSAINWTPIGSEQDKCFAGIFDGQSNEIQNLTITGYANDFAGLFGYVHGGEIKDLTLTNVSITTSGSYAGAICGRIGGTAAAKYSPVTNCVVDGTITSTNGAAGYVGGIAGYVNTYANIADCNANVDITAYSHAGGIAGYVNASNSSNNIIENCISSGSVTTSSTYAGGIVGYFKNDGVIYNCVNRGAVQASANAGGIAGRIDGADSGNLFCIVESCRNDNTVTSTASSSYAGGIVGYANTYVKIKKSANSGDVTAKKYTGGILGYSPSTVSAKHNVISNCANSAVVTGTTYVGGIFGSSTYTDVSYNNNGGNVHGTTSAYVGGIAGLNPESTTLLCNISTGTVVSSTVVENALVGTSSTGTITETYYDNQRTKPISANGQNTLNLIGSAPSALTAEGWAENFVFNENMYPMPNGIETYSETKLAATPIIFNGTEISDSVFSNFTLGTENSVSWTSNDGHIEISGASVGVTLKCTEAADVELIASITDEVTLQKVADVKLARVKLSPIAGQTAPYNVWVSVATSDDNDWTTSGNWLTYDGERYSNATAYPVDGANVILIHNDEQIENTCEFVSPVIDGDKLVGNILVGEDVTFDMGSNLLGVEGNATINGFIIGSVEFGAESACDGDGYIDGPITKHGSSAFKFLTGHDGNISAFEMTPESNADVTVTYHSDNTGMLGGSMSGGLDHVSDIEYWHIESNKTLTSVKLYYGAGDHGIESTEIPHLEEDLRIAYSKGSEWINIGGSFPDGWEDLFSENRGYVTSTEGIPFGTRDGGADVASGSLNAKDLDLLPIELISFTASCNGTSVNVEWTTASEKNNDYFVLEKSYDAVSFTEIARVEGAGNSIEENSYSYTDNENYGGEMYYRLQQVDNDGTRTASEIIVAKCADYELDPSVAVFPNPFRSELTLLLDNFANRTANIEVYDMLGKMVLFQTTDATQNHYELVLNLGNLPNGTYTVRVSTADFVMNRNVVKN